MRQLFQSKQAFSLFDVIRKVCANQLQAGSADLIKRRGGKLVVFANDTIGNAINASGLFEWSELEAIFDFLKPLHEHFTRSLALDIGANIGNHSIYFSRYFKAVHAFEPHPLTYRLLDINASLYRGIIIHNYALSDSCGNAHLHENPTNLGGSRIEQIKEGTINITLKKLDDLDFTKEDIALIKMDVEGHEANVLRGGVKTLQQTMPIVLFEAHATDFDSTMEEVNLLKHLGYRFAWIQPLGTGYKKYAKRLAMLISGQRTRQICTAESIPRADHSMIIAIPPRWQPLLGME